MVSRDDFAVRLFHATMGVITSEEELIQADAEGGRAMTEVASAVSAAVAASDGSIRRLFEDASLSVSRVGGDDPGVSFWVAWLDGLAAGAPDEEEIDLEGIKALFDKALDDVTRALAAGLCDVAPTDVLAVVSVAVSSCDDELDAFDEAADAAEEATAGTGDPVSLSVARFPRGLAQA